MLSLVFFAYPVAAFLSRPDYAQAGGAAGLPALPGNQAFLLLVVALIGTTITPYMQFYVAAAVADRGIGPADYPGEKLDTIAGSIFCNVISIFIIVATAAAIHVRAPLETAKQAAQALAPVAGRFARSCSRSASSAPAHWPPWSSRSRPPTPSARPPAPSAASASPSARPPCSSACSPARSSSAAPSP